MGQNFALHTQRFVNMLRLLALPDFGSSPFYLPTHLQSQGQQSCKTFARLSPLIVLLKKAVQVNLPIALCKANSGPQAVKWVV